MPINWDEQDSAFFGELLHDSKPSAHEELAKRLQKQFLDEQEAGRLEEQKDREFAQKLNQHSQTGGLARGFFERNARRSSDPQDKDAALAKSMQEEEDK
jgi:hypothetical protein